MDKPAIVREYPALPLVGVGAVIVVAGKVALVKRGSPPLRGQWSIPGGILEIGETLRQAATREVQEETGLVVQPKELLGVFDRVVQDKTGRVQYHYVLIDFLCREVSGVLRAGGDADDVAWFNENQVAALPLPEDTKNVIRLGFETAGS